MLIVDFTVLALMSTTDTVPEPALATYSVVRSGEYTIPAGFTPKRILVILAVAARGPGFEEVCGGRLYPSFSPPESIIDKVLSEGSSKGNGSSGKGGGSGRVSHGSSLRSGSGKSGVSG